MSIHIQESPRDTMAVLSSIHINQVITPTRFAALDLSTYCYIHTILMPIRPLPVTITI